MAIILLMTTGCLGQDNGSVTYTRRKVCSLKGSSVTMPCSYTFPKGHKVTTAFWFKGQELGAEPLDLNLNPEYKGRVEYLGDSDRLCTLRITDLRESDSGTYSFLFGTDVTPEGWMGNPGVRLNVTGLHVDLTSDLVVDGKWAALTCGSCILSENPTYTWYRDKQPLTYTNKVMVTANYLELDPVGREDAGSYSCGVSSREDSPGPAVILVVGYFPKNTSVSVRVSPSGEIVEGRSVTLTCSRDDNPPVDKYTWYKKNEEQTGFSETGSGQSYIILNISSEDSGQYVCKAENKYGPLYSEPVYLSIPGKPEFPWAPIVGVVAVLAAGALLVILYTTLKKRRNPRGMDFGGEAQMAQPDDTYMTLNRRTMSPEYDTLANVRNTVG
ncbi:hemicentin-2-like [Coregonus clupeaformis]|uniref:hemicentin-2-like n=1 Tax=Coregonus clupeaformis TaxID=59861 RepID=UPI001E1C3B30|nr:hemicentin-2-like [Coregonus clupeaformis]